MLFPCGPYPDSARERSGQAEWAQAMVGRLTRHLAALRLCLLAFFLWPPSLLFASKTWAGGVGAGFVGRLTRHLAALRLCLLALFSCGLHPYSALVRRGQAEWVRLCGAGGPGPGEELLYVLP